MGVVAENEGTPDVQQEQQDGQVGEWGVKVWLGL